MGLGLASLAATPAAAVEDTFPREATRAEILRWLAGNSDLMPDTVVTMTDELVVAITAREDGRGVGRSTRLGLREEVINPDAAAAWGGRSIQLDLDLDCERHRVILGSRRIYARPNLQGGVRITRSDNAWAEVPADTVIDDVARAACASPGEIASANAAQPVEVASAESTAAPAPAPKASPPAATAPVHVRPPQTADAKALAKAQAKAKAVPPAQSVQVAAAAPPSTSMTVVGAEPAAPAEDAPELKKAPAEGAMVHNPYLDRTAGSQDPPAKSPAALPAMPASLLVLAPGAAQKPADYAVQIAAAATPALAHNAWQALKAKLPKLVGARTFAVEPVMSNGHTLYRALVQGFASRDEAAEACKTLRGQSIDCILRQLK